MIIDAHTHILLDDDRQDQTVDDLLRNMDAAGIDRAAVFASTINRLPTNARVLKDTKRHRDRLFVVGSVSPLKPKFRVDPKVIDDWLGEGRIRALKFYTGYEHFYPDDERLRPYMELLVKHGRPAIFHMGDCYDKIPGARLKYAQPLPIDDLAVDLPDLKIIIAHMAPPWVETTAEVCYKNPNVYTDCSGFVYGGFDERHARMFRAYWQTIDDVTGGHAADKILFGTDWPISDTAPYVDIVRDCAGDAASAGKIFSDNARKLFGL